MGYDSIPLCNPSPVTVVSHMHKEQQTTYQAAYGTCCAQDNMRCFICTCLGRFADLCVQASIDQWCSVASSLEAAALSWLEPSAGAHSDEQRESGRQAVTTALEQMSIDLGNKAFVVRAFWGGGRHIHASTYLTAHVT